MKMMLRKAIGFSTALAIAFLATGHVQGVARRAPGASHREKLDTHLRAALDAGSGDSQRVIIRVRPGERAALRRMLSEHGDRIVAEHESIDAITTVVHAEDLETLAGQQQVVSVSSDAIVRAKLLGGLLGGLVKVVVSVVNIILPNNADTSGPAVPPQVLRDTLGLGSTWTGSGIGVAVIDSGLEQSSEFDTRLTAFFDFTKGDIRTTAYDDYGHGTHIAGTIGGSGALSYNRDYRGLAPKVKFTIFKVLDKNGAGWTSDVIRAIDFAVANRAALGIDIINLSLGHPIYEPAATDPLVQAVERASRAGVIVVAAAGNYGKNPKTGEVGYAGITSPGNAPSAITAGALRIEDTVSRSDDSIPDYSSRGPTWYDGFAKPDFVAPGHNIIAVAAKQGTLYKTYPQLKADNSNYMRLSGTSMATAVTTGVIAQMLEANRYTNNYPYHPSLTPNAVKAMLQYSAFPVRNSAGVEYNTLEEGASPRLRTHRHQPAHIGSPPRCRRGRRLAATRSRGSRSWSGARSSCGAAPSISTSRPGARWWCGAATTPRLATSSSGAATSCGRIRSPGRTSWSGAATPSAPPWVTLLSGAAPEDSVPRRQPGVICRAHRRRA